jgi:leader peptidase (prepilin peptidase)/N-methyltransferase
VSVLVVLTAFIDWDNRIIPNKITYPSIAIGLGYAFFYPELWPLSKGSQFIALGLACASVSAAVIILALFAALGRYMFKKDALGWGDIKYIAAVAALLGPFAAFFSIFVGPVLGAAAGLIRVLMKKAKLDSGIPFGVPLAIGTYMWIFIGLELLIDYLNLFSGH